MIADSDLALCTRLFESGKPGARFSDLSLAVGIALDFEEYQALAQSSWDYIVAERLEGVSWHHEDTLSPFSFHLKPLTPREGLQRVRGFRRHK